MTSKSLTPNQLKSFKKYYPTAPNLDELSPLQLNKNLRTMGCSGCELGCQKRFKAPVVYRGNPNAKIMVIGEAPGYQEDEIGLPFTGPAGKLLNKILSCIGLDDQNDLYFTNVVKCRPVAALGAKKQNETPNKKQRDACKPYLLQEISYINPKLVLLVGKTAAEGVIPHVAYQNNMASLAGKIYVTETFPEQMFFVIYHPAAILHAARNIKKQKELKEKMWEDVKLLKEVLEELNVK